MSFPEYPEIFAGQQEIFLADNRLRFLPVLNAIEQDGIRTELRPKESLLLAALALPPDVFRSRGELNHSVFNDTTSNTLAVTATRLRERLSPDLASPKIGLIRSQPFGNKVCWLALSSLVNSKEIVKQAEQNYQDSHY